jgi:hypothetical protein
MMIRQFSSVRDLAGSPLTSPGRQKVCRNCGGPATKEALFEVGNGISVVERYCEQCVQAALKDKRSLA